MKKTNPCIHDRDLPRDFKKSNHMYMKHLSMHSWPGFTQGFQKIKSHVYMKHLSMHSWPGFTQGFQIHIYPVISNSRMIFRNWKGLEGGRAAQKNMSNMKHHINFTAWIFVWHGNDWMLVEESFKIHVYTIYLHLYVYIYKYMCVHISPWHCAARLAPQRWMLLPAYAGPNGRDVWTEGKRMLDN